MKNRIKLITARFRGKCGFCRLPINPGDLVGYDHQKRRVICGVCARAQREDNLLGKQREQLEQMKIA